MLTGASIATPHPQVVDTPLEDGGLALLRVDTRQFYRLNATGAWLWSRLAEGEMLGEIAAGLTARYAMGQVDPLVIVVELVGELLAAGLVEERGDPPSQ